MKDLLKFVGVIALGLALSSAVWAVNLDSKTGSTGEPAAQESVSKHGDDVPIVLQDPAIADHDIGNVLFTISNFGQYGLAPTDLNPTWPGQGFKYPQAGTNLLFEGALLIGDGPTRVSDAARDSLQVLGDDFVSTADIAVLEPGPFADQEYHTGFDDSNADIPLVIEVSQETYAFSSDPDDDYVITEYTITNTGAEALSGVLVAHFEDWDMPWNVANDLVNFDRSRNLGYQYNGSDYRGQQVLSELGVFSFKALDNATEVYPPRFSKSDKWDYMNAGTADTAITSMADCSMMITTGPYDIAPGESVVAAFAIIGGDGLADLQANADAAMAAYQEPVEDIVYFEDFDSGMGDWAGEWGLATNEFHSDPNSLADSPVGNYADYDTVVVELMFDIDLADYVGARLEFWTKYDIELGFDYIYLDGSSDGGSSWIDLYTFNGEGVDWHNFVTDIGAFAGQNVRFRFTLESDAGYNVDGMYVDDFTVFGTDTDTSPPLILHPGPTDSTSVPGNYTAIAAITDVSGVESSWLTYMVDGGEEQTVSPDSIVGDLYYFTIPMAEAGAHVEYVISAVDNVGNEGSTSTKHYVSGTVLYYDDGEPEFIYQYFAGYKNATRMTPEESATLVTGMLRLYTDVNRPLDTVDVQIWAVSGSNPGNPLIDPFAVWPEATLENPQAWTYVDFRDMGISIDADFFLGWTYRSEWPVILGDSPAVYNRSRVFDGVSWAPATTDFHIRAVVDYGQVSIEEDDQIPTEFALRQNYPNPFNASTVLNFSIIQPGHVKLNIYNVLGQHVVTLVDGHYEAGRYSVTWDAGDMPSGVYFARLQTDEETANRKMMLLK
jgi:hypothetical protein